MTDATHVYIGIKHCGCTVAASVDFADANTGQNVAAMIRDGLRVERVPLTGLDDGTVKLAACQHEGRQAVML
jgi:hypothetical protein